MKVGERHTVDFRRFSASPPALWTVDRMWSWNLRLTSTRTPKSVALWTTGIGSHDKGNCSPFDYRNRVDMIKETVHLLKICIF